MSAADIPNPPELEQMFLGRYDRPIDPKGRITLPAAFREALGNDGAVLTRGLDRCLYLFPRRQFAIWRERIRGLPITDQRSRALRRHIFAEAADATPDGQGRILVPGYLRDYAGLQTDVVIAGNDTYVEIWDAGRWAEMSAQFMASGDDAAAWDALGI
jgi:MraZ protein